MKTKITWIAPYIQAAVWFISFVVIPLTIWFTLVRSDVKANSDEITQIKVTAAESKKDVDVLKTKIDGQFQEIQRSLGRIEGKLDQ